jgi:hypothetical protein
MTEPRLNRYFSLRLGLMAQWRHCAEIFNLQCNKYVPTQGKRDGSARMNVYIVFATPCLS